MFLDAHVKPEEGEQRWFQAMVAWRGVFVADEKGRAVFPGCALCLHQPGQELSLSLLLSPILHVFTWLAPASLHLHRPDPTKTNRAEGCRLGS